MASRLNQARSWIRRIDFPAWDVIASVYFFAGLAYISDPSSAARSPLGQAVDPYTAIWSLTYLLGALMVLCGRRGFPAIERSGLWLLIGAWAGTYVATVVILGPDIRALAYPMLILGAATRLRRIPAAVKARRKVAA